MSCLNICSIKLLVLDPCFQWIPYCFGVCSCARHCSSQKMIILLKFWRLNCLKLINRAFNVQKVFLHCWNPQSVTLINQLLRGDAKTKSENRLVLSHSLSHENMVLGVWIVQIPTVWAALCQACRHDSHFPTCKNIQVSAPVSYAKLKMAAYLSVSVGSLQQHQHKHVISPIGPNYIQSPSNIKFLIPYIEFLVILEMCQTVFVCVIRSTSARSELWKI